MWVLVLFSPVFFFSFFFLQEFEYKSQKVVNTYGDNKTNKSCPVCGRSQTLGQLSSILLKL